MTAKDVWENNGLKTKIDEIPFFKEYLPETEKYTLFAHRRIAVRVSNDEKVRCEKIDSKAVDNV